MKHTLSTQAQVEMHYLAKNRVGVSSARSETPPFRGGTQELADAGLITFDRDDGLWTYWDITPRGFLYIADHVG